MESDNLGKLFIVGSLNIDTFLFVTSLPAAGETVKGNEILLRAGGKGFNQAVAAAKCGADVTMIGAVGEDRFLFDQILSDNGVSNNSLIQKSGPTGQAFIEVDDTSENRIIIIAGANELLGPSDLIALKSETNSCANLIMAQNEIPIETIETAFAIARSRGWKTILNTAPAREIPASLLAITNILICNASEAEFYLGVGIDEPENIKSEILSLLDKGPETLIITLGSEGAVLYTHSEVFLREAFPVLPIDTTGAGDAFCGGFAAEFLRSADLEKSLNYGLAAGSLATTRIGPSDASPKHDEVIALLTKSGRI